MEMTVSKYQFDNIIKPMQDGATIQCSEGANYRVWLKMPDGTEKYLRKQSAILITNKGFDTGALTGFGDPEGITLHPRAKFKIK